MTAGSSMLAMICASPPQCSTFYGMLLMLAAIQFGTMLAGLIDGLADIRLTQIRSLSLGMVLLSSSR